MSGGDCPSRGRQGAEEGSGALGVRLQAVIGEKVDYQVGLGVKRRKKV